jgi:hypothetical protein
MLRFVSRVAVLREIASASHKVGETEMAEANGCDRGNPRRAARIFASFCIGK